MVVAESAYCNAWIWVRAYFQLDDLWVLANITYTYTRVNRKMHAIWSTRPLWGIFMIRITICQVPPALTFFIFVYFYLNRWVNKLSTNSKFFFFFFGNLETIYSKLYTSWAIDCLTTTKADGGIWVYGENVRAGEEWREKKKEWRKEQEKKDENWERE